LSFEISAGRTLIARELFRSAILNRTGTFQLAGFDIDKPDLIEIAAFRKLFSEEIYAKLPVIDSAKCRYCGICAGFCTTKAIQFNRFVPSVTLIVARCESCGKCMISCNRHGIKMVQKLSGKIFQSKVGKHHFIAAQLTESGEFQLPLIKALNERLLPEATVICDFGPGNGIQVSYGLEGIDFGLIVIRPVSDWETNLELMLAMLEKSNVTAGIILNNIKDEPNIVNEVKLYCTEHSIPFLGIIPYINLPENEADIFRIDRMESSELNFSSIWNAIDECMMVPALSPKEF
jgi:MinD superfamily P-loop ATPase